MSADSAKLQATKISKLTEQFSVSGEFTESELSSLVKQGVDTLINVRPDNESEHQMSDQYWRTLAQKYHLQYFFIPVKSGYYKTQDINEFKAALLKSSKRTHSFCRTGTRASHLWALANKDNLSFTELQAVLNVHGFDLTMISIMFDNEH